MTTRSVTNVARNFSAVLDPLERDQEEVVLVRNQRQIARLIPEAPRQSAVEARIDRFPHHASPSLAEFLDQAVVLQLLARLESHGRALQNDGKA